MGTEAQLQPLPGNSVLAQSVRGDELASNRRDLGRGSIREFRRFLTAMARYSMRSLTQNEKEEVRRLKVLWDTGLF